jgi:hypothetical protein
MNFNTLILKLGNECSFSASDVRCPDPSDLQIAPFPYVQAAKQRSARLPLLSLALVLMSCSCNASTHSSIHNQTLLGVCPDSSVPVPIISDPKLRSLVESVVPSEDVIRGYWTFYSFAPPAGYPVPAETYKGYRAKFRISSLTWVEVYPPIKSRSWVVGRGLVHGQPGTIALRLHDADSPRPASDIPLEGFIPDARDGSDLFRERKNGAWGDWQNGQVIHGWR